MARAYGAGLRESSSHKVALGKERDALVQQLEECARSFGERERSISKLIQQLPDDLPMLTTFLREQHDDFKVEQEHKNSPSKLSGVGHGRGRNSYQHAGSSRDPSFESGAPSRSSVSLQHLKLDDREHASLQSLPSNRIRVEGSHSWTAGHTRRAASPQQQNGRQAAGESFQRSSSATLSGQNHGADGDRSSSSSPNGSKTRRIRFDSDCDEATGVAGRPATASHARKPPLPHQVQTQRGESSLRPKFGGPSQPVQTEQQGPGAVDDGVVQELVRWHEEVSAREAAVEERESALRVAMRRFGDEVAAREASLEAREASVQRKMQDIKAVVSELRAQERRLAQRGRDLGGGGGTGSPKKGSGAVKGGPGGAAAAAARLQQREADLLAREEQHWRRATALERREAQISKQLRVLREQEVLEEQLQRENLELLSDNMRQIASVSPDASRSLQHLSASNGTADASGTGSPARSTGGINSSTAQPSPGSVVHAGVEELRALLADADGIAAFSRSVGHGTSSIAKNQLLFAIDVQAFRLLQDREDLELNAHEMLNQFVREGAKRDVGLADAQRRALRECVAAGGDALTPHIFDEAQIAALQALEPLWRAFCDQAER